LDWPKILTEISFRTSRSSGAGGQHVNKTETKVEVLFEVMASEGLSDEEKAMIMERLVHRITEEGVLVFKSQKFRSQVENKEQAILNLNTHLVKALTPVVKRVKTKPTKGSIEDRLESKRKVAEKKELRRKPRV
jgi:ribosome-associated protein